MGNGSSSSQADREEQEQRRSREERRRKEERSRRIKSENHSQRFGNEAQAELSLTSNVF